MKNKTLWIVILFILMPVAYYFAFVSFFIVKAGGNTLNYLIFFVSCLFIIITNVALIKQISKELS